MEGDGDVYAHSSLWMRPTGEWSINAKMVYTEVQSDEYHYPFYLNTACPNKNLTIFARKI